MEALLSLLRRDRLRRARQLAEGVALLAVVGSALLFVGYHRHLEATRCEREARQRAAAVMAPMHQGPLPSLGAESAEILAEVDARLAEWTTAQQAACESAERGDPDGPRALQCLDEYRARAQALAAFSPTLTAQKVDALLDELSRPARCRGARPPDTSGDRDPRLLQESAEVAALFIIGRHEEAVARGRPLVAEARAAGAPRLAAFTAYYLTLAIWESHGTGDEALYSMSRQAVRDADLSGDPELSLRTRVRLFDVLSEGKGQFAEAEQLALDAEAWLKRLGYPPHLDALYTAAYADLLSRQGRHDEAVALFRRVIQLDEQVSGPRAPNVADAYNSVGVELQIVGRLAEAAEAFETSIRLHEHARWHQPATEALALGNLAITRLYQGRAADALSSLDRAEQMVSPLGADLNSYHVWLQFQRALVLEDLGRLDEADKIFRAVLADPLGIETDDLCELHAAAARLLLAHGQAKDARVEAEAAEKIATERAASPSARGQVRFTLAQALWAAGEKERALALAREALKDYQRPEDGHRRGRIERWLAEKAPKR
jgi:tetratricopeptide (TPR) repeat protein